jgi:hypothetical protein
VGLCDDVGHGERFARTGDAEQRLKAVAAQHAFGESVDRLRLIAGELIVSLYGERRHMAS